MCMQLPLIPIQNQKHPGPSILDKKYLAPQLGFSPRNKLQLLLILHRHCFPAREVETPLAEVPSGQCDCGLRQSHCYARSFLWVTEEPGPSAELRMMTGIFQTLFRVENNPMWAGICRGQYSSQVLVLSLSLCLTTAGLPIPSRSKQLSSIKVRLSPSFPSGK